MERRASAASSRSRKSPSAPRAGSTTCSNPCTTRTRRSSSPWITRPSPGKCTGCSVRRRCCSSFPVWPATTACGWRTRRSAGRPTSRSCAAATAWAWRASSARCPCKRSGSAQHKKLHAAEEAILKEAERELNEEFAYVLGLSLEETPAFIRNLIETDEESEEAFAAHLKEKN